MNAIHSVNKRCLTTLKQTDKKSGNFLSVFSAAANLIDAGVFDSMVLTGPAVLKKGGGPGIKSV
jgi:hypothetical protein